MDRPIISIHSMETIPGNIKPPSERRIEQLQNVPMPQNPQICEMYPQNLHNKAVADMNNVNNLCMYGSQYGHYSYAEAAKYHTNTIPDHHNMFNQQLAATTSNITHTNITHTNIAHTNIAHTNIAHTNQSNLHTNQANIAHTNPANIAHTNPVAANMYCDGKDGNYYTGYNNTGWMPDFDSMKTSLPQATSASTTTELLPVPAPPPPPPPPSAPKEKKPKAKKKVKVAKPKGEPKRVKRKKADPKAWKRNVEKLQKFDCKPYKNYKGVEKCKIPKPVDCTKCRHKCPENFSEEDRQQLCSDYWKLAHFHRQQDYLLKFVKESIPRRPNKHIPLEKKRTASRTYFLMMKKGKLTRVCKAFFERTLCISNGPINLAFQKFTKLTPKKKRLLSFKSPDHSDNEDNDNVCNADSASESLHSETTSKEKDDESNTDKKKTDVKKIDKKKIDKKKIDKKKIDKKKNDKKKNDKKKNVKKKNDKKKIAKKKTVKKRNAKTKTKKRKVSKKLKTPEKCIKCQSKNPDSDESTKCECKIVKNDDDDDSKNVSHDSIMDNCEMSNNTTENPTENCEMSNNTTQNPTETTSENTISTNIVDIQIHKNFVNLVENMIDGKGPQNIEPNLQTQMLEIPEYLKIDGQFLNFDQTTKKRVKRKVADPSAWKKNVRKQNMFEGRPYKTKNGVLLPGKVPQPIDCAKCRFKCAENFSDEDRQKLCSYFWKLRNYSVQKDYILKHVKESDPKRPQKIVKSDKHRLCSRTYFFLKDSTDEDDEYDEPELVRVCKTFFERTLCISNGPINKAFKNNICGFFVGDDKRGRGTPFNKTKPEDIKAILEHIKKYRKVNKDVFKESKPQVPKMHKAFTDECQLNNRKVMSLHMYRKIYRKYYGVRSKKENSPKKDKKSAVDINPAEKPLVHVN